MRRLGIGLTLVCAAMAPAWPAAAGRTLAEALAKMDEAAVKFKGLSANIVHVTHTDVIHEDEIESGLLLVKRPRAKEIHVRINYQKPASKVMVSDGNKVELYYPDTGQVDPPYELGHRRSMLDMLFALGFGGTSRDLQNLYQVTLGGEEEIAGESATRLQLIPKSADLLSSTKRIDVWISNSTGHTLQQKLYENGKDYHIITYTNIKPNPDIPDSEFKLPKPGKRDSTPKK